MPAYVKALSYQKHTIFY